MSGDNEMVGALVLDNGMEYESRGGRLTVTYLFIIMDNSGGVNNFFSW